MKKKIFGCLIVLAIAVASAWNVNINSQNGKSDFALKNVEALAQETTNNQNCSGMYCYPDRKSNGAKSCTLYKQVHTNGSVEYTDSNISLGGGWTVISVKGLEETCPQSGNGCEVYSCHQTNNT